MRPKVLRDEHHADPHGSSDRVSPLRSDRGTSHPTHLMSRMSAFQEHASAEEEERPALDAAALARLKRFGGSKLLVEMIGLYLTAAPERLAIARAAVAAGDISGAEGALHSLKSSSAQLGGERLSILSERGELLARGGSLGGVYEIVNQMDDELGRVQAWLIGVRDGEPT